MSEKPESASRDRNTFGWALFAGFVAAIVLNAVTINGILVTMARQQADIDRLATIVSQLWEIWGK